MSDRGDRQGYSGFNLLFFLAGGVRFAVDADQVAGTAAFEGEAEDRPARLFELLGCDDLSTEIRGSIVLAIKTGRQTPLRVVVDLLEDMAEMSMDDIRSFPPLIEPFALQKGIWGVVERGGRLVLLLDFQRLIRNKVA